MINCIRSTQGKRIYHKRDICIGIYGLHFSNLFGQKNDTQDIHIFVVFIYDISFLLILAVVEASWRLRS